MRAHPYISFCTSETIRRHSDLPEAGLNILPKTFSSRFYPWCIHNVRNVATIVPIGERSSWGKKVKPRNCTRDAVESGVVNNDRGNHFPGQEHQECIVSLLSHVQFAWAIHICTLCLTREAATLVKNVRHLVFTTTMVNFRKLITRCPGHRKILHVPFLDSSRS